MLAAGASGVLLGHAWAFALAAGGQAAVSQILDILVAEMRVAMALTGVNTIRDIDRTLIVEG